jgi:tRNA(Ile)-lysidine synthase
MRERPSLEQRFRENLHALGLAGGDAHVLAAVSGGIDSVVLLHLLRFASADLGIRVTAAHFDHAMRRGSEGDARWVRGLCAAWGVRLIEGKADRRMRTEEEAREARYAFLRAAKRDAEATHLATAHHADDQAETVLFRILRGTGPAGLAGIPAAGAGGLVRPLLPFWRAEIRRYARSNHLRWRSDPTNATADPARNRIRLHLLPLIERTIAPGARRNLVRLAELAAEDEAAWERALAGDLERVVREEEDGSVVLVRSALAVYDSAAAARVLRSVLRRFGVIPGRSGTRSALQFISTAPSGRRLELPGGVRVTTEFDAARIERTGEPAPPPDAPLEIRGASGGGRCTIGGRILAVAWRTGPWNGGPLPESAIALPLEAVTFPLTVRGWRSGDRIRTPGGTKTLRKLFAERKIPRRARPAVPVLADAAGTVLWAAGVARGSPPPRPGGRGLTVEITDA